ncbi:MAG: hypothetical protein KME18_07625 [Phormidium tanganyikae FI6-MK23]|jgi:hypothetical protein|nr:hypothetical protein [Phormidium tanganyikae FI6-MK23]
MKPQTLSKKTVAVKSAVQFDRHSAPSFETLEVFARKAGAGCGESRDQIRRMLYVVNPTVPEQIPYFAPVRDELLDRLLEPILQLCLQDEFEAEAMLEALIKRMKERAVL